MTWVSAVVMLVLSIIMPLIFTYNTPYLFSVVMIFMIAVFTQLTFDGLWWIYKRFAVKKEPK